MRDDGDELVTNDNLRSKIKAKVNLKYVPSDSDTFVVIVKASFYTSFVVCYCV